MSIQSVLNTVLPHYTLGATIEQIEPIRSPLAFSGAELWRIRTALGDYLLRRWPEETDPSRIAAIHRVLRFVAPQLPGLIAPPLSAQGGSTAIHAAQTWWSLSPWLSGSSPEQSPVSEKKIENASRALAKFHRVAKDYPADGYFPAASLGIAPGLQQRLLRLRQLPELVPRLVAAKAHPKYNSLNELRFEIVQHCTALANPLWAELQGLASLTVPLQLCLRDVWRAHVLYEDDEVTGLIDYDALRIDSVAADISRLLGSLAGDEMNLWQAGLVAYAAERPLSEYERNTIIAYDRSAVLLTGLQWLEWIYLDNREFSHPQAVEERVLESLNRLRRLHRAGDLRTWV